MEKFDAGEIRKIAKINTRKTELARRTTTANGIAFSAEDRAFSRKLPQTWNLEIETSDVTNQKISGRCWLFASLNHLRHNVEREQKMKNFELSETYNYFYDKLEKANNFLEKVWAFRDEKLSSRHNEIFENPETDGGWWDEAAALVDRYGAVPKSVMPESSNTGDSRNLNTILTRILRRSGLKIRRANSLDAAQKIKRETLADVYRVLSISLGEPPKTFSWSFATGNGKKKKIHRFHGTPQDFARRFGLENLREKYVKLMSFPTLEYGKIYASKFSEALAGERFAALNVDVATLKPLIIASLKAKESVPVALESQRDMTAKNQGVMDPRVFDFENLFDVNFDISRRDRAMSGEDVSDHEMLIVGADLGRKRGADFARFYKVENSWGKDVGDGGFWAMSDAWADEYLESIVVKREILPENLRKKLAQEPILLEGWQWSGNE